MERGEVGLEIEAEKGGGGTAGLRGLEACEADDARHSIEIRHLAVVWNVQMTGLRAGVEDLSASVWRLLLAVVASFVIHRQQQRGEEVLKVRRFCDWCFEEKTA